MKRAMGIDYGRARIGLALSDELRMLAHPLETVPNDRNAVARVAKLTKEREVDAIVIGMPRMMAGQPGSEAGEVREFILNLERQVSCPIVEWDERLTTVAAERALQSAGKKTKDTRGYVDQVAAQLILQGYLDREQMNLAPEEPNE